MAVPARGAQGSRGFAEDGVSQSRGGFRCRTSRSDGETGRALALRIPRGRELNGHGDATSPSPSPVTLLKIGSHDQILSKKLSGGLIASER